MHNITKNDRQEGRNMAWHGLTVINSLLTLADCWLSTWDYLPEIIIINGKETPFTMLGVTDDAKNLNDEGEGMESPLIVGLPYNRGTFKPITNKKLIALLDEGTSGKDIFLSSCGTVRNRGRQFFSFQLGEEYKAAGRNFVPFFNIGNGNDKSSTLWQNTSATCTVCDNTFEMNYDVGGLIMEVKKTKFSELKLADFSTAMKSMLNGQKQFSATFESLGLTKASEETAREFFAGVIGIPSKKLSERQLGNIDTLVSLFKTGKGNEGKNFADVFSALTDFYTHQAASGQDTPEARWKNFVSSEFGSAKSAKQRAWVVVTNENARDAAVKIGRAILKETAK